MSKKAFTIASVKKLACPTDGYVIVWDKKTPGLGIRLTAGGARSYVFERRLHGHTVRTTIGAVDSWELKKAQAEARRLATVIDDGINPHDQAKEQAAQAELGRLEERRQGLVLEGVWHTYIEERKAAFDAKRRKPAWGARQLGMHLLLSARGGEKKKRGKGLTKPGPLASLMHLKLSELTADTIATWLRREAAKRPTNAAQSYRLLRAFIRWTHEQPEYRGVVPADACTAKKVVSAVPGLLTARTALNHAGSCSRCRQSSLALDPGTALTTFLAVQASAGTTPRYSGCS